MPAPKIAELRKMSNDELINLHDKATPDASLGVNYYVDELARRDQSKQTETILRYTRWIVGLTIVMTLVTVVNVVIAYLIYRHP